MCWGTVFMKRRVNMCEHCFQGKRLWGGALGICKDVFGDRENVHTLFLGRERVCAGTIFREREGVWALYL